MTNNINHILSNAKIMASNRQLIIIVKNYNR